MQQIEHDPRDTFTGRLKGALVNPGIRPATIRFVSAQVCFCILLAGLVGATVTKSEEATGEVAQAEAAQTGQGLDVESRTTLSESYRGTPEATPSGAHGGPGLDALLQLPSSFRARESPSVAGADEAEWRRRFVQAEQQLATTQQELARVKRELDEVSEGSGSSQWAVAPPGASSGAEGLSTSPLSFKLREAMRRSRDDLDAAERALRELKIEADLAGVPVAWRAAGAPGSTRGIQN